MFFVATGIAPNMAKEIWSDLEDGLLSNAANLTNSRQVSLFTQWLITL